MAGKLQRPKFLCLSSDADLRRGIFSNEPSVFSPMTELARNFEENCKSHSSTPRRRLSLSDIENTPVRIKRTSETESVESGICIDFSAEMVESPTITDIRSRSRKSGLSSLLRRQAVFRRCNSLQMTSDMPEPVPFSLNDWQSSPLKRTGSTDKEDKAIAQEMHDAGLPEELKLSDCDGSLLNRSHSAPPVLDCIEKYFTDLDGDNPCSSESDGFDMIEEDQQRNIFEMPTGMSRLLDGDLLNNNKVNQKVKSRRISESRENKENACPLKEEENIIHENKVLEDAVYDSAFKMPSQFTRKIEKRSLSFSVKRTDSQRDFSPISSKRTRFRSHSLFNNDAKFKLPVLQQHNSPLRLSRSLSVGYQQKPAADPLKFSGLENPNIIGDKSGVFSLPTLEKGQHQDLKAISPETMSAVLNGAYKDKIGETLIVDCRYPYEFKGGHIKDAVNVFNKEDIIEEFLKKPRNDPNKKMIIIFHCEFSSKRGPNLCRFLRNKDRDIHKNCYPKLYYPELYLLEGGYKAFFGHCKELCEPQEYLKMVDENHSQDLKHFIKRSKSWSEGNYRTRTGLRY